MKGYAPRGWLGPWISETGITPDLLKEAGYSYVLDWPLDDQPVWLATRAGPLLAMPYPVEINDAPAMLTPPSYGSGLYRPDRRSVRRNAASIGTSSRSSAQSRSIRPSSDNHSDWSSSDARFQHIRTHVDGGHVWFTRPGEIADHVVSLPRGVRTRLGDRNVGFFPSMRRPMRINGSADEARLGRAVLAHPSAVVWLLDFSGQGILAALLGSPRHR